jgi:hypothetical protein
MVYKAFQDYYNEQPIKHLLVHDHNGILVSPPFATEQCKNYSTVLFFNGKNEWSVDLDLPPATSKFNSIVSIEDSVWLIPYGIWDDFNVVVQLKNFTPIYHYIDRPGKGQFYNAASNGSTAFSFPLGYEETNYGLFIKDGKVETVDFNKGSYTKLHMGTVYCNGRYWSAPRGDEPGYINLMSFDGRKLKAYPINVKDSTVTRKFTDIVVCGNKLFSLPFGETPGATEILEFDTETNTYKLHDLDIPDFAKKFNVSVLVDDTIIALPYGDEHYNDSNWGITYNTNTGKHKMFDIGIRHGGKYRFRSGISYNDNAVFLPSGTPSCPILSVNKNGEILTREFCKDTMLGRPVIYDKKLITMGYNFNTKKSQLISLDSFLR